MIDYLVTLTSTYTRMSIGVSYPSLDFAEAMHAACPGALRTREGWTVQQKEEQIALDLVYKHFPVIKDMRFQRHKPLPTTRTRIVDPVAGNPFTRLDLVPMMAKLSRWIATHDLDLADAKAFLRASDKHVLADIAIHEFVGGMWAMGSQARTLWHQFGVYGVSTVLKSEIQPDGSLVETLHADDVIASWHKIRGEVIRRKVEHRGDGWFPTSDVLPVWVAGAIARLGGGAFTLNEAGDTLSRRLPSWILRGNASIVHADMKDIRHNIVSASILPSSVSGLNHDVLVHVSVVGSVSKNRALWAGLLDGKKEPLQLRIWYDRFAPRRMDGRKQYRVTTNDAPLPVSGLSHMDMTHVSAFEPNLGESFLHLTGNDVNGTPDLTLFAQQLSRAIPYPFDLSIAPHLWRVGLETASGSGSRRAYLIHKLPSTGCQGYWVSADEKAWAKIIIAHQLNLRPNELRNHHVIVREVKATAEAVAVAEHVEEDTGDSDDDF